MLVEKLKMVVIKVKIDSDFHSLQANGPPPIINRATIFVFRPDFTKNKELSSRFFNFILYPLYFRHPSFANHKSSIYEIGIFFRKMRGKDNRATLLAEHLEY